MTDIERFGLPLSLVEALREDASETAAELADLMAEEEAVSLRPKARSRWQAAVAGLALSVVGGFAAAASTPSLEGRWVMAADRSTFLETVVGPAPDRATVVVTEDDGDRLTYQLVEDRQGARVASATYDVSFKGGPSTSAAGGAVRAVTAVRQPDGAVVISAPKVGAMQAQIRVRLTGPNSAVLEHDIQSAAGTIKLETISLVRKRPAADRVASAEQTPSNAE